MKSMVRENELIKKRENMKYVKNVGFLGLIQMVFLLSIIYMSYLFVQTVANIDGIELFSEKGFKEYIYGYWLILGLITYLLLRVLILVFSTHEDKYLIRGELVLMVIVFFPLGIYMVILQIGSIIDEFNNA